jgi:hypothetical protein
VINLILLTCGPGVIKTGVGNPLHFDLQNQGPVLVHELIIDESLWDQQEE